MTRAALLTLLALSCACLPEDPQRQPVPPTPDAAPDHGPDLPDPPDLGAPDQAQTPTVALRLLTFNDLHGHLEAPAGTIETAGTRLDAGGAAFFGAHLERLREGKAHTVTACAGDLIGASPLISAMFHDEPTIEAMDLLKLDMCAVGNHEFDEGYQELLRIQNGGCHPTDGCKGLNPYPGAKFQFLGANVKVDATGKPLLPPYMIREFDGVKVGFIGLTLEATGFIVTRTGVVGLTFEDEVEVINRYAAEIKALGVHTIVVLIHEGGSSFGVRDINDCGELKGPIVPIAQGVDDAVVALVTGHTHQHYNCTVDGKLVTSARSYGRAITAIDLELDPATGRAVRAQATNHVVTQDVPPHEAARALVARYRALVEPLAREVVGQLVEPLLRAADESGQSPLGLMIADSHLEATRAAPAGAQVALINRAGLRADLIAAEGVSVELLQRVQPFGNTLVTMTLTGAQLEAILEEQLRDPAPYNILQPARTLRYTWRASAPSGDRIRPADVFIDGQPLDLAASYRVTVVSYLASGGDGFDGFTRGQDPIDSGADLDATIDYVRANSPLSPPVLDRITRLP